MGKLWYDLDDKVFVVTGGSRGIGFEIARQLLDQNARVVICGRKQEGLDAAGASLGAADDRLLTVSAHVAREADVDRLFAQSLEKFGRLDGLINNVGMNIVTGLVASSPSLWQKIIDTNLSGTYLCSRKAAQIMQDQNQGKIVSISSIAGRRSAPAMGIYGIAKAGVEMMTKVLAMELAPFNIQVNAVAPSMVKTDFSKVFWSNKEVHDEIVKNIPLGRIPEPVEIAHPALFLCSRGADFMTGHTILVDGGSCAV